MVNSKWLFTINHKPLPFTIHDLRFTIHDSGASSSVDELDQNVDMPDDRRRYDRSRVIVDVFFDGTDATGVASTKDISVGGFYMNTQAKLPEGAVLLVRIPLENGEQVVANAQVVYTNPGSGVGLRFQGLSDENRALLESGLRRE
jgi:hypothetical protein